jgi:hypothetical protein
MVGKRFPDAKDKSRASEPPAGCHDLKEERPQAPIRAPCAGFW